jgi:D-alanine--poly(phosphoribitol) ligase subunit 2
MATGFTTIDRVRLLIQDVLSVDVADGDTDLIESGLIDSLGLVTMIVEIEQEFRVELPLDDLDVDRFRSVNRIAEFLAASSVGADGRGR